MHFSMPSENSELSLLRANILDKLFTASVLGTLQIESSDSSSLREVTPALPFNSKISNQS